MNQDKTIANLNSNREHPSSNTHGHFRFHQGFIFVLLGMLLVITAYVWLISFGLWTRWPFITNDNVYYDQLAVAFQHGSLSLEAKPNSALLTLHDPYDPNSRNSNKVPYPIDFSLYKGKFYLYFGPVPALFLLIFKFMGYGVIGDNYIYFVFAVGLFIIQSLLIMKIWKLYFKGIPTWILSLSILFGGLISPIPWTLTQARVYEAASGGGQFFFLAGLCFLVEAVHRESISVGQFLVTGLAFALAIGTRLTQIVPIGFVSLMTLYWLFGISSHKKPSLKNIYAMLALCLPLGLGLAVLGWYNWARFGSVFETGLYYQLAGPDLQENSHVLFSMLYVLPNSYNYWIVRPAISTRFPFLESISGAGAAKFSFIHLPAVYHAGGVAGIIFSTPFVLFAAVPLLSFLLGEKPSQDQTGTNSHLFRWLIVILAGSFLFGSAPVAMFFFVETRYIADFMPSLALLSIIGFWQGYLFLTHKPVFMDRLYIAVGILLMAASVIASILLTLSVRAADFQRFDPALWKYLTSLFAR